MIYTAANVDMEVFVDCFKSEHNFKPRGSLFTREYAAEYMNSYDERIEELQAQWKAEAEEEAAHEAFAIEDGERVERLREMGFNVEPIDSCWMYYRQDRNIGMGA